MRNVAVIGCGWLGMPLAIELKESGYHVSGSTTSAHKLATLEDNDIHSFLLKISSNEIDGDVQSLLKGVDTVFINIPPGRQNTNIDAITSNLITGLRKGHLVKIIYISSISVYAEDGQTVYEDNGPFSKSPTALALLRAEDVIRSTYSDAVILRLAGLTGNERHPVKHLAGRTEIPNPDSPINLLHLQDAIAIIKLFIQNPHLSGTYNLVTPYHPSRRSYYLEKAKELHLELPRFTDNNISAGKIVSGEKLSNLLQYEYKIVASI